jgi:Zn-dependent M28 family amino/carboxypeptidase
VPLWFLWVLAALSPTVKNPAADLRRHVEFLSAINPPRNHRNLASLETAVKYIRRELHPRTKEIRLQEYTVNGRLYKNVIANFGPRHATTPDADLIVVGAHYDSCGDTPGADDNASGVASLLLLAERLAQNSSLRYRYELVFYSLEEPPYFRTEFMGSAVHARDLKSRGVRVKFMLSLETMGYFSDRKGSQSYPAMLGWFYPSEGNFIALVGRRADGALIKSLAAPFRQHSNVPLITLAAPSFVQGIDFSDQLNYWEAGYTAAMLTDTAFLRNHNYHELTDMPGTLDYPRLAQVVEGIYAALTDGEKI